MINTPKIALWQNYKLSNPIEYRNQNSPSGIQCIKLTGKKEITFANTVHQRAYSKLKHFYYILFLMTVSSSL